MKKFLEIIKNEIIARKKAVKQENLWALGSMTEGDYCMHLENMENLEKDILVLGKLQTLIEKDAPNEDYLCLMTDLDAFYNREEEAETEFKDDLKEIIFAIV